MKYIFAFVLVAVVVVGVVVVSNKRDQKLMVAMDKYEECVKKEYGVSPQYWFEENGEYPVCE